ncbi:50S rRNA methyltransferase [Citrobacter freundii]|nr:50S rRNA methyltransferase [Citrobacter freundii]
MRAEGTACRDAGSAPTRQADGIRRMNRVATIFPPEAWVAREAAASLPCPFTGAVPQTSDAAEVNGTLSRDHMFPIMLN